MIFFKCITTTSSSLNSPSFSQIITNKKNINENNFLFSDSEFIFSDKFITNPEIEKYYGKYNQVNSKGDSIQNRIN